MTPKGSLFGWSTNGPPETHAGTAKHPRPANANDNPGSHQSDPYVKRDYVRWGSKINAKLFLILKQLRFAARRPAAKIGRRPVNAG